MIRRRLRCPFARETSRRTPFSRTLTTSPSVCPSLAMPQTLEAKTNFRVRILSKYAPDDAGDRAWRASGQADGVHAGADQDLPPRRGSSPWRHCGDGAAEIASSRLSS